MAARTDKTTDPTLRAQLLLARRGQSYFSRKLNELSDAAMDDASTLSGWDRRHVIAHVGLNARALTRLTEWAASGVETPMYDTPDQRLEEIDFAATLPTQALRNLSDHAAIHLNVEWRDLEPEQWSNLVRTAQGRTVPASETVWMRTREVWIHAVDLANGASFDDFPAEFVDAVIADVLAAWGRRREGEGLPAFRLDPIDREATSGDGPVVLRGRAAQLAAWASGRPWVGVVTADGSPVPVAPRWF
ncbi:maleylpyruvate isomerase family mycothiol-dependent enzyme [Frondihabitans cladoniiphilus]|uniref:Mycothiol-dependent maleylpyruvate isomerase NagL n=1 Tax=Frondihabitans cladoniiphilus TaxID=715785 RepID=A0ABP8WBA6_9MICO